MGLLRDHSVGRVGTGSTTGQPLERFTPTTGKLVGYAGLAAAAFALGYCVVSVHSVVGLRIGLGAVFLGVVIWVSQLRPRAAAYADTLHLKGSVRDVLVPYVAIDEVTVTQMLNVFAGGRRYVCVGIGVPMVADMRQRAKKQRNGSLLGSSRSHEFSEKADLAAPDQTAMSYPTFVVTRIEELVDAAKRQAARKGQTPPTDVRTRAAVPEVVALAATGLAFLVSFFL